jgi:hypothetical protein
MAMWRRPPGVEPPAVLFAFDPVDWPAGSYEPVPLQMFEGPGSEWEQAFRRWKAARRDWVAKHPNSSFGGGLTRKPTCPTARPHGARTTPKESPHER